MGFACTVPGLSLRNDAGARFLTPALTPGGSGTVSNSQCTVSASGTSVNQSGNSLTLNVALTFSNIFTSPVNVYLYSANSSGQNSGWVNAGSWTP